MPKSKYQQIIEEHCSKEAVTIPTGFYRRSAGHLAVIKYSGTQKQLVATTWTKSADVINYLTNYGNEHCQINDFKKGIELVWNGAKSLTVRQAV
ncbi:hypothetical protein JF50_03165 [Pseudoalteromonas luteoviolacea]|uniref:Uncharacterized protein n=1 Tax=Pseudoalteromonas luteoviolacea TaxID=43657 RepID=A0A0C1QV64_9GAMM|nr:hypothetical protein [Pseudoalteromonas luteoviolacea]KID58862.1 hypothetical protein JF50_03165 [Pseudoalteromonas luteoviolacea]